MASHLCNLQAHLGRRTLLKAAGLSGALWLTPLAEWLARAEEKAPRGTSAKSVIFLWLSGGPSQLETFDPHPAKSTKQGTVGSQTKAIDTSAKGVQISELYPRLAEQMEHVSLVRSVMSKEGDHERGAYTVKTGYRPDPTLIHPAIGAVLCHQLQDNIEVPRHVSILPDQFAARGGYLGDQFDAFRMGDPVNPVPDITPRVPEEHMQRRLDDLQNVVEKRFAQRRLKDLDQRRTLHASSISFARKMMSSEQLKAFDVAKAPQTLKEDFGDSAFGRGCLAALQLVEVGVRCVEISLGTFDSHINNLETHKARAETLDPAFAALLKHLQERELLDKTIVICAGEFGRTPRINAASGRDHWPHGFTVALAGGGIAGGRVIGETAPEPALDEKDRLRDVADPRNIEDIHATVLHALGIDFEQELQTPIGRPMAISSGQVIRELLA